MSYTEALEVTKKFYPFDKWREGFKHGLEQYTEENCQKAQSILDTLITNLIPLGQDAEEASKVQHFKTAVLALNDLDDSIAGLIETGEREDLCELFDEIAKAAGIDSQKYGAGDGIASEWRDW